ncbi:MAG: hypothetical protein LBC17_04490 [Lactobacillaceae bacterium]|jgi:hypothetical protein|nr:hypothetical protein [Lactobacillaceae bacterium]
MNWITGYSSERNDSNSFNASFKPKNDTFNYINQLNFKRIHIFPFNTDAEETKQLLARIDGTTAGVRKDDLVIFQYPNNMGKNFRYERLFIQQLKIRKAKIIGLIHDIDSLRFNYVSNEWKNNEVDILNKFDGLITHNDQMSAALKELGVKVEMTPLYVFGFDSDIPKQGIPLSFARELNYAGALFKSEFLGRYNQKTPINVFGDDKEIKYEITATNLNIKGPRRQEQLFNEFKQGFGLIWDESTIKPFYQEYTRYNAPFKLSLYLRAGMPVVAWSQAAIASQINEWGVGFTIDALDEIDAKMAQIDEEKYNEYRKNAQNMARLIQEGNFVKKAVLTAIEKLYIK